MSEPTIRFTFDCFQDRDVSIESFDTARQLLTLMLEEATRNIDIGGVSVKRVTVQFAVGGRSLPPISK
jgi:hypothetical protein